MKYMILALSVIALPSMGHAQAYKCKDQAGKTFISSMPCQDGKKPVAAVAQEYIPPERQIEAMLAHQRRRAEAGRIDAGYEAAVAAQQRYYASQRTAQNASNGYRDKACEAASRPYPGAQNGQLTAAQLDTLASCGGQTTARSRDTGTATRRPSAAPPPVAMPAPPPAPSVITSCDAGGCWDNMGGRYTKGAGNTHFPTTGGGACQMIGGQMRCS